jgi:hypothetical protein
MWFASLSSKDTAGAEAVMEASVDMKKVEGERKCFTVGRSCKSTVDVDEFLYVSSCGEPCEPYPSQVAIPAPTITWVDKI